MKILFVSPGYPPKIGGVEYVVKSVAERLVKKGHEVVVIAGEPRSQKPSEEFINDVEIIRWPTLSPGGAYHIPRRMSKFEEMLLELAKRVDVIHVHSFHAVSTVSAGLKIGKMRPGRKLVVTGHYHGGGHTTFRNILWNFWRLRVKSLLDMADVIHCVSQSEKKRILKDYPEFEEKIVVIPNGVDEDVFTYRWWGQESNYMLYAGRIEKYKKLDEAIKLSKKMNLKLTIIGQGPYQKKLKKKAEKLYPNGVEFKGFLPRRKYLETLANARYAINLSNKEAYSIFIAEALAIRVPAMVSKEIAENLEAESNPFNEELALVIKAPIKTWNEIAQTYLSKLY
ncbi:MAG: glycosyltransferase family 1 protein [Thermoprotei archaeon]|nr:MAG: glycosyltransferase family 1 protein [Thermoprotei archaeon]